MTIDFLLEDDELISKLQQCSDSEVHALLRKVHPNVKVKEDRNDYDLYETPLWVDIAANHMEKAMSLDLEAEVLDEQVRLLEAELLSTSQRVNLFEKVKIPETQENIKKISIYMADQQVSAVVRSKISKRKIAARDDMASDGEVYSL